MARRTERARERAGGREREDACVAVVVLEEEEDREKKLWNGLGKEEGRQKGLESQLFAKLNKKRFPLNKVYSISGYISALNVARSAHY